MKALVLTLLLTLIALPVYANIEAFDEVDVGAKVDAPNLVKLADNHAIGLEASINELNRDWDESQVYLKYTYTGSILDFSK